MNAYALALRKWGKAGGEAAARAGQNRLKASGNYFKTPEVLAKMQALGKALGEANVDVQSLAEENAKSIRVILLEACKEGTPPLVACGVDGLLEFDCDEAVAARAVQVRIATELFFFFSGEVEGQKVHYALPASAANKVLVKQAALKSLDVDAAHVTAGFTAAANSANWEFTSNGITFRLRFGGEWTDVAESRALSVVKATAVTKARLNIMDKMRAAKAAGGGPP